MDNTLKNIANAIIVIVISPIIVLAFLLSIPVLIIGFFISKYQDVRDRIQLKSLIKNNDGQIFLIYADYNQVELSDYINDNYHDIKCIKTINNRVYGLLENYVIKENRSKCYPRLTKIDQENLAHKEHYNSFRRLVKRNNNTESFYELLDKSITNLKE